MSQLNTNTPIKHVWNRVRKISGKNVCPSKQYLNGKDGAPITDPRDIANEHAAAFTDNSSSAHSSSGVLYWRLNPVPLDLTGSTTTCWNTSLRTHYRSSKRSWTSSGSMVISLISGGQQQWSHSPNQTRTTLTHSVTDPLHWPVVLTRSLNAWITHALSGILKNMAYWTKASVGSGSTAAPQTT